MNPNEQGIVPVTTPVTPEAPKPQTDWLYVFVMTLKAGIEAFAVAYDTQRKANAPQQQ